MSPGGVLKSRMSKVAAVAARTALVCAALAMPATAEAAVDTRTVNSTLDPGDGSCATNGCTLREAITELNLDFDTTDQDQINIAFNSFFDHTITLVGSGLTISDPVAIASTGVFSPTVSGNDAVRPFTIPANTPGDDVSISGLAITDGLAPDSGGGAHVGGAISSSFADLTILGAAVRNSSAPGPEGWGGGISARGGSLTILDTTVSGNTARGNGGGIEASDLTIARSTISGNRTTADGFGLGDPGGGIIASGPTLIEKSTISGNHTEGDFAPGGGAAFGGVTTIRDSTVYGNYTQDDESHGGGLFTYGPDPTLSNTIVGGNNVNGTDSTGPDLEGDAAGDDFELDYSLVGNTSSAPIVQSVPGSNILDDNPDLGVLQGNGGPTFTHLPGVTSPVLDKGRSDGSTDQRGLARTADFANISNRAGGDATDIGSVEIQIAPPTFISTSPPSPSSDDTPAILGTAQDGTVRLSTDPGCTTATQTGAPTADEDFAASGIVVNPVPHNATTTFYGSVSTAYGNSLCSSGPFPGTISYTQADPVLLAPDLLAPSTTLGSVKINRSTRKAKFTFSSNEPGSTFLCKIDKKAFASCSSPKKYKKLKRGKHKFQVQAKDAAGNLDGSPAVKKFRI
jgi:CSLREA domain-containing protein